MAHPRAAGGRSWCRRPPARPRSTSARSELGVDGRLEPQDVTIEIQGALLVGDGHCHGSNVADGRCALLHGRPPFDPMVHQSDQSRDRGYRWDVALAARDQSIGQGGSGSDARRRSLARRADRAPRPTGGSAGRLGRMAPAVGFEPTTKRLTAGLPPPIRARALGEGSGSRTTTDATSADYATPSRALRP